MPSSQRLPRFSSLPAVVVAALLLGVGCTSPEPGSRSNGDETSASTIDSSLFTHHYLSRDLPGDVGSGYGLVPPADLDIASKLWSRWSENANGGREHVDVLENRLE